MNNSYCITGASSNVAKSVISNLIKSESELHLYSTKKMDAEIQNNKMHYNQVKNYNNLKFPNTANKLLVCNGYFSLGNFDVTSSNEIEKIISANLTSVIQIVKFFISDTDKHSRRDIFILGSSAAYDLGSEISIYAACKMALRGFITSLNKEYAKSNTRFTLISFGTVNNEMGLKVPNQDPKTLLQSESLANEITQIIESNENYYQPEVLIRRRFMQQHQ